MGWERFRGVLGRLVGFWKKVLTFELFSNSLKLLSSAEASWTVLLSNNWTVLTVILLKTIQFLPETFPAAVNLKISSAFQSVHAILSTKFVIRKFASLLSNGPINKLFATLFKNSPCHHALPENRNLSLNFFFFFFLQSLLVTELRSESRLKQSN